MALPVTDALQRREQVMALAQTMPHAVWRGDALGRAVARGLPTGYAALDAELPGNGWCAASLTELLFAQQGSGEFRLLTPALKTVSDAGRTIVLVGSPHALISPALEQAGIDVAHVLVVNADKPADRLWTAEQVLRSGNIGALLSWHPQAKSEHLRRLQVAAGGCDALTFIFRPATARAEPSPAPLRLECRSAPFGQLSVDVFKRRGPAATEPVLLPALFAPSMTRALARAQRGAAAPVETTDVVDRRIPSGSPAGSRVPSLA